MRQGLYLPFYQRKITVQLVAFDLTQCRQLIERSRFQCTLSILIADPTGDHTDAKANKQQKSDYLGYNFCFEHDPSPEVRNVVETEFTILQT